MLEWILNGLISGAITVCKVVANNSDIATVGACVGALFVTIGKKEFGMKLVSGSVIIYLICKIVSVAL